MLKGVHASAKSQWIDYLDTARQDLINCESQIEIKNQLKEAANTINGIGQKTVDETWLYILEEKNKQKRGF